MKFSAKTENVIKTIVSVALVVATLLGVAALFKGPSADDDERIKITPAFSIGGLNEDGKYIEDDGTIYTKEAFECQGLKIELDFEETINYEVFFYNEDGDFVESSGVQEEGYKLTGDDINIRYARIEIIPDWDLLEVKKEKEQVVKWYEVAKYANQMTVKVYEDQEIELEEGVDLASHKTLDITGVYYGAVGDNITAKTSTSLEGYVQWEPTSIRGYDEVEIVYDTFCSVGCYFVDADGVILEVVTPKSDSFKFDVPENAVKLYCASNGSTNKVHIYGYCD